MGLQCKQVTGQARYFDRALVLMHFYATPHKFAKKIQRSLFTYPNSSASSTTNVEKPASAQEKPQKDQPARNSEFYFSLLIFTEFETTIWEHSLRSFNNYGNK